MNPELDRRQFLQLALSCSALLLIGETGLAATFPAAKTKSYARFEELPVGAVKPEGWLKTTLEKQAAGLGSQLPKVSWPFTEPYWRGEKKGESWWPWEQMAYYIDGATRLALVLDDRALMLQVRETIDYTLKTIDFDGYIGPAFFKEPKGDDHRWPHTLFFRGLAALSDSTDEPGVVEAMATHYTLDAAAYGKPVRNVTNIETILWCHARTADPKFLAMAEKAWADYLTVAADPEHGDLSAERTAEKGPINAHGVTYIETAKQPAILFAHTGKQEYLDFALDAQARIFEHHMLIDGVPSTSEWYRGVGSLDSHETCDISDHTWSWGYLLMATGDGLWGDRIERACFNGGFGAIKKDWTALQYFSCPNQFLATLDSDHNAMAYGGRMMAFQPNPGQRTACCGGNIHRLLPNYASRMWMKTAEGGFAATLYGPSKLATKLNDQSVAIEQTTDYPFDETIHLKIGLDRPASFPLSLRIPLWCATPRLEVNGKAVPLPEIKEGFVTVHQEFRDGDTLSLTLPMTTKVSHWPDQGVGLEHGPLVYSLPIEAEWTPVVEARYSTPEYPSWNATPTSAWNFALTDPGSAIFVRDKMTKDPWSNPPLRLKVHAKRVEEWKLRLDPVNPSQRFTPPLPDLAKSRLSDPAESILLVPYGATHLRVTVFPLVGGNDQQSLSLRL